eukprot:1158566-Pelagomonas_calceolata.AAC.13
MQILRHTCLAAAQSTAMKALLVLLFPEPAWRLWKPIVLTAIIANRCNITPLHARAHVEEVWRCPKISRTCSLEVIQILYIEAQPACNVQVNKALQQGDQWG